MSFRSQLLEEQEISTELSKEVVELQKIRSSLEVQDKKRFLFRYRSNLYPKMKVKKN